MRFTSLILVALVALVAACSSSVDGSAAAAKRLPVAELACPDHVDPSATFTIDGSKSSADGALKSISLTVQPGHLTSTSLTAQFHIDTATVATAVLVVTDDAQNKAQARCRFAVGDPSASAALPPSPPPSDAGEGEGEGAVPPPPPPGVPVDLNGRFALVSYDRPKASGLAMYPETQCGEAPSISLVDITQTDAHVSMTITTCVVEPMPVQIDVLGWQPVELTSVPAPVVAAMSPIGPVEFDLDDGAVQGARFAPPLSDMGKPQTIGAHLTDPNGTLPTDGSDPQVDDADGDGNPGVTIVTTATYSDGTADSPQDEHVVMRHSIRAFAGTITSSDVIDGSDLGDYQADEGMSLLSSLGAMFLPSGAGLPSTFMMNRVDASTTCAQIQASPDQFLAALPSPGAPQGCAAYPDYASP